MAGSSLTPLQCQYLKQSTLELVENGMCYDMMMMIMCTYVYVCVCVHVHAYMCVYAQGASAVACMLCQVSPCTRQQHTKCQPSLLPW